MQLYLMAYEDFFENEASLVTELMKNYTFTFHLRKPGASLQAYRDFLLHVPEHLHPQIMLHDAFELVHEFKVKGLHFSTSKRTMHMMYPKCFKSTSAHSLQEMERLEGNFAYQFISPVHPSISKPGYTGNLDMAALKDYLSRPHSTRVVALGGIRKGHITELKEAGFDGVAVSGSIWGHQPQTDIEIPKRFDELYALLNDEL